MVAANTSRGTDWDSLVSTTIDNYRSTLSDNVWNGRPLHAWLNKKDRKRMLDGGPTIVEPLIHGGGQAGWYAENDILSITPQDGISAATYDWGSVYASIQISGREKLLNSGKEQVINLLDAKVMQAEETLKDLLSTAAYDTTPDANAWLSIPYLINAIAAEGGTEGANVEIGGIDSTVNTFWNSKVYDGTPTTGDFGAAGLNTGELVRKAIRTARNASSDSGSDRCDAAFTDLATYEAVEDSYVQGVRYEDVDSANAGFENIEVSKMPLFWDFHATPDTIFGINSKYLTLVGHKDRWMEQTPFSVNPVDGTYAASGVGGVRDAQYSIITAYGQLTCRNRRRQFRINNVSL